MDSVTAKHDVDLHEWDLIAWIHPDAWRLTRYIPGDKVPFRASGEACVFACFSRA